jgi:hypothetical protein
MTLRSSVRLRLFAVLAATIGVGATPAALQAQQPVPGAPGWNHEGAEADVTLSVDGAAPVTLRGGIVLGLVLTKIEDPNLLQRLRVAHTLDWTFPFGRFRAAVTGLGTALDAVNVCRPEPARRAN